MFKRNETVKTINPLQKTPEYQPGSLSDYIRLDNSHFLNNSSSDLLSSYAHVLAKTLKEDLQLELNLELSLLLKKEFGIEVKSPQNQSEKINLTHSLREKKDLNERDEKREEFAFKKMQKKKLFRENKDFLPRRSQMTDHTPRMGYSFRYENKENWRSSVNNSNQAYQNESSLYLNNPFQAEQNFSQTRSFYSNQRKNW